MADNKITPLEEVKLDAEFNYTQRLKEQQSRREHEEAKAAIKQPSETKSK